MEQNLNSEKLQLIQEILAIESEEVLAEIRGIIQGEMMNDSLTKAQNDELDKRHADIVAGDVEWIDYEDVKKELRIQ